ncbi:MAG: insulinase family protein [Muribaculaceae bacterium]|nr:insulinase family protein [Muribaculaceae bacterium]
MITRFTLPNGLRVVHYHDRRTAMAAVDVMYDVGARDESRELTGVAHLFEHLMFGGSVNEPRFDVAIERAGGVNNAWTGSDFTNFFELLPAQNIETALRAESDRMLALSFDPHVLQVQRSVVVEEFKQTVLNRPYGRVMHHLRSMLYHPSHPYSWPVIGLEPEHIMRVTDDDARRWFYAHYAPNNAVLAVAGNVEPGRLRELVEKWFGDIPRREIPPRVMPSTVWAAPGDVRRDVTDRVPSPLVMLAWPMAAFGQPGYTEADIITDLLGAGRAARLRRNVSGRRPELVADADASIMGSEHEGMLMIDARLVADSPANVDTACTLLLDEALALTDPANIAPHELERALRRFEARDAAAFMSPMALAQRLAAAEMHGEDLQAELDRRRAVGVEDIARTARGIFIDSPRATLVVHPEAQQ